MACLTPQVIYRDTPKLRPDPAVKQSGTRSDIVPCGKCPACLSSRQATWAFRLQAEQKFSHSSSFLTLTYSDENLPFTDNGNQSLDKSDFQKFLKRLRKHHPDRQLKYYACGEYGTQTHRPHYHAIMFNAYEDAKLMQKCWPAGHIRLDPATPETIHYVTKYIQKRTYNEITDELDDRIKEFALQSKGLGLKYLSPQMTKYLRNQFKPYLISAEGKKVPMPRYFKEKLFTKQEQRKLALQSLAYLEEQGYQFENIQHEWQWKKDQYRKNKKKDRESRQKL